MGSKAHNQRIHSKRRALQRHGIKMTDEEYEEIIDVIRKQLDIAHFKITNTRVLHIVPIGDRVIPVIYDRTRKTIATVLPKVYYIHGEI